MEEMMRKFKDEFKSVYNLYLEASDLVESIDKYPENYDKDDKDSAWTRFKRKSGQLYELRRVAKILGYTLEDINSWEEKVYNEYKKNSI